MCWMLFLINHVFMWVFLLKASYWQYVWAFSAFFIFFRLRVIWTLVTWHISPSYLTSGIADQLFYQCENLDYEYIQSNTIVSFQIAKSYLLLKSDTSHDLNTTDPASGGIASNTAMLKNVQESCTVYTADASQLTVPCTIAVPLTYSNDTPARGFVLHQVTFASNFLENIDDSQGIAEQITVRIVQIII